jgi:hypothetical protein
MMMATQAITAKRLAHKDRYAPQAETLAAVRRARSICILRLSISNSILYAVIPFVSAMNAVSKLISSSLKSVSLCPDWTRIADNSL